MHKFKEPRRYRPSRPKPAVGEIYHIYNRGTDKRNIFLDDFDRLRFIHDIYEFNDKAPAQDTRIKSCFKECKEVGLPYIGSEGKNTSSKREIIVEILAYCLMDNHYHFLVREIIEGGITAFMRKLGTGYTNYFNQKYERSGVLFQGKFKISHIDSDSYLIHMPYYIHLNPLDYKFPEWREGSISNTKKAIKFIENYRWSSFLDYIGKKNFPSLINTKFLEDFISDTKNYVKGLEKQAKKLSSLKNDQSTSYLFLDD